VKPVLWCRKAGAIAIFAVGLTTAGVQAQQPSGSAAGRPAVQDGLHTFTVDKPQELIAQELANNIPHRTALVTPRKHDRLRATLGLGYVQGADWASEIEAGGSIHGLQLRLSSLVTVGATGVVADRGSVSLFDPDRHWHVEGGDLFSQLRGASRGARLSWHWRSRRPAISLYGPYPGATDRTTTISYRDQIQVGSQTLLDAEVATNKSYVLLTRLGSSRINVEAMFRSARQPIRSQDLSGTAGVVLWRGIAVTTGASVSRQDADRGQWRTVAVRVPFSSTFSLTVERAYGETGGSAIVDVGRDGERLRARVAVVPSSSDG
jgi:hypothetical protein